MTLGFRETWQGSWVPLDGTAPAKPIRFELRALIPGLGALFRDRAMRLDGSVRAAGLATDAPATGTVEIGRAVWRYRVSFTDDAGGRVALGGERVFERGRLVESMSFLRARLLDVDGQPFAKALFRFDLQRELGALLGRARIA